MKELWEREWFFALTVVLAVVLTPLALGGMVFGFAWMIAFVESWPWPCIGHLCGD